MDIYRALHTRGYVMTIEAYQEGELVGGLWGIKVNRGFGVMSMFHNVDHAGSVCFARLVEMLQGEDGGLRVVDCVTMQPHFSRFGAELVSREEFSRLMFDCWVGDRALPAS
jgi:leucyl/phenylalanyl-tRNA--protein transferase